MEDGMGYLVLLFDNMKVMHLPTFQEFTSTRNGCGLNYSHNYGGYGGVYHQRLVSVYFSHCDLLDSFSQLYLLRCDYFDIEIATNQINTYARIREQQFKRNKKGKK